MRLCVLRTKRLHFARKGRVECSLQIVLLLNTLASVILLILMLSIKFIL